MKKALISVSDKTNLEFLLKVLEELDYQFISTGGTAKYIKESGFTVKEVSELTHFPEMLGGRVKTLHPKVLGGILARRDNETDIQELEANEIEQIDLVVVNLYPFEKVINQNNVIFAEAIENIDIGGPTLLRSAAKNFQAITVLSDPMQYQRFVDTVRIHGADSDEMLALKESLAIEVFKHVSNYDNLIANFLKDKLTTTPIGKSYSMEDEEEKESPLKDELSLTLKKQKTLRYGENPHQEAGLYVTDSPTGLANLEQLHGKEISFNNLLDVDAAWNIVNEYEASIPCVSIIKHNNPCGVAIAPSGAQAFIDALSCDTVSAFGGIVASNVEVDLAFANELSQIFLECIIAPDFSKEAIEILSKKKNIRLLKCKLKTPKEAELDIKAIDGAFLVQEKNNFLLDKEKMKIVTKKEVEESEWVDIILAWKVVKHVKSNAIVAVKDGKTIGIGCGQMNRVKAVEDALAESDIETRGCVLASDAFFPFPDNINIAAQNHVATIIQPGGSVKDQEVIAACDDANIAMVFTGNRHFKH